MDENALIPPAGGVVHLKDRIILSFTGADRVRYLNGQLTANLVADTEKAIPSCVTTAKGKLCGDVIVTVLGDRILVDADRSLAETLPPRMERYIVSDDVIMKEITESHHIVHAIGINADQPTIPGVSAFIPANRYGVQGVDIHIAQDQFATTWNYFAGHYTVIRESTLETLRIEKGVPRWGFELNENVLPAEAGLDATHVDFKKGCYIGQEVISRIKSVGHVNRSLTGFIAEDGNSLAPGSSIFTADQPELILGNLTSCTRSLALDASIALGYLKRNSPATGLMAASKESPDTPVRIQIHPHPFI